MRILLMALFLAFSNISAQTFIGDTLSCYTHSEMLKIASGLVRGKECDTLLKISEIQLSNDSVTIHIQDSIIRNDQVISSFQDTIIKIKDYQIKDLNKKVNRTQISAVALLILLLLFK